MAHGTRYSGTELKEMAEEFDRGEYEVDESAESTYDDGSQATGTTTMTLRLPVSMIAALKRTAALEGVGATILARRWIAERLAQSPAQQESTIDVADLMSFIAERARSRRRTSPPRPAGKR